MRHLKEVIPIFRKTSLLSEIGWDLEQTFTSSIFATKNGSSSASPNQTNGKSDTKTVPLFLCHLTKPNDSTSSQLAPDQISDLVFEIYSPDRKNICILKCPDSASASAWFSAIHSTISNLLTSTVSEANNVLSQVLDGAELKHMDWIYEKVN